jgi:chitinase
VDKESGGDSLLDELLDDVITNKPLVANAGSDMTYQSEDDGSAVIILDGSATKNQQGKVITWSWTDDTGREISTLTKFRAKLSIGIYRFELRVSDFEGNSTTDSVQIEVV